MQPGYTYRAEVLRVVDADTFDVSIDLGLFVAVRERIRLYGVDAWEVRGHEREAGKAASVAVTKLLADCDRHVIVRTHKDRRGKFGRFLAEVFLPVAPSVNEEGTWLDLGAWLVENGHAEPADYGD